MRFGKIIRKPVKKLRKISRTGIRTEKQLYKEDPYKDVDGMSATSEESSVASTPSSTTNAIAATECDSLLPKEEKTKEFMDCGYEVISIPKKDRPSRSCDAKTPRRSSLKSSESTSRRRSSISYRGEIKIVLPNGEEVQRRTSISFEENENQTKEVKPILNMVENPNQIWFQKDDYANIKQDIALVLKNSLQAEGGSSTEPNKESIQYLSLFNNSSTMSELPVSECTRGLEPIFCESVKEVREQANTSVLEEYLTQRNRGEYNDDVLRQIYSLYTIDSHVEAASRADLDRQEVQKYLEDTRNIWT